MEKILELLMKKYSLLRDSSTNDQTILTIILRNYDKVNRILSRKAIRI